MNKGFFKTDFRNLSKPIQTTGCASCGLANGVLHPKMEPTGEGNKDILIIAEAPGEVEDRKGVQLIGKVGQRLRRVLRELKIDLDMDCRKTNAVRCRPPENRQPTPEEISSCRKHIFEEIERFKPKVIIPLGSSALQSLLGGGLWKLDSDLSISRWRGLTIPDHQVKSWICPTFHPSYVERTEHKTPAVNVIWKRDLERAVNQTSKPLPDKLEPEIETIKNQEIEKYLLGLWKRAQKQQHPSYVGLVPGTPEWMEFWKSNKDLQPEMIRYKAGERPKNAPQPTIIAFDYETTGLKPYHSDHRIVSCSIAENPHQAKVWRWGWMNNHTLALFRSVMENLSIKKIAANLKFEQVWTRTKLGYEVNRWYWDTVMAGRVLDNRSGNSGTKFLSYTLLGLNDYSSHVASFLKASDSNAFNQIDKIPESDLLEYNGKDSCFEFAIHLIQKEKLGL